MRHKGRRFTHEMIEDAGRMSHDEMDYILHKIQGMPIVVPGARDDPEDALANLLAALEEIGLIVDSTTTS
jgi:hypothetical protein